MAATDTTGAAQARSQVELSLGGMTCASCATRIEKRLNRLDGVTATVNYATERAKVDFPAEVEPAELIAAVEEAGYTAALPATRFERGQRQADAGEVDPTRALRDRLIISSFDWPRHGAHIGCRTQTQSGDDAVCAHLTQS